MKRKFSFTLPPLKMPSKTEPIQATPEPTPLHAPTPSHRRHHSKDSVSMLNSSFISRRPLSPRTEQELRSACALILQNYKPSDHELPHDAKSRLDTNAMGRKDHGSGTVRVHRPTGAPAEPRSAHDARKHLHSAMKEDPVLLPMQANTGRRRAEHAEAAAREQGARSYTRHPSNIIPSATAIRDAMDADDANSLNSPLTSSTESHMNNGSTAPTSAAFTSSRSSKRASRQFDNAAAVADAQAAEWMKQEVDKRRQQQASQPQSEAQGPGRVPSRSRSIRTDIKEYIFPGSTNMSRTASKAVSRQLSRRESHESMRSQASSSQEPRRSGSSHGWRSWGLQRKFSSRSNSRPGTSKGRIEGLGQDKKSDLNLNRELPPLPSLDSWKQSEQHQLKPRDNRKSQAPGAHIATLMRPQDQQQQDYAAAIRRHHRRSGSDTLAMRFTNSNYAQPSAPIARTTSHRKPQLVLTPKRTTTVPVLDTAMDFDEMMSAMDTSKNFNDQLALNMNGHSPERGVARGLQSPSMSMKMSSDQGRLEAPRNFSRKISADIASALRDNPAYPNTVQIEPQKSSQKSKLKKVFSVWMLKKEKKENWMDQFEKKGVKTGVMVQDEAALAPVVRY
ncbi:hypothetical protein K505DRAFT_377822 [Melanomma pulvis-pyrius CBS 109.77]|uniref:Uncharacterized protein n=1 Tax=Melanomma pulvis-pyrius CBS 109.77 TaxID=1314802 RepID=A0A6A6X1H0_9PLEO|nr:hypothetical protein K505DRAFT_377822 [Melanomma pulvis-pyrius CBS 109.77]